MKTYTFHYFLGLTFNPKFDYEKNLLITFHCKLYKEMIKTCDKFSLCKQRMDNEQREKLLQEIYSL